MEDGRKRDERITKLKDEFLKKRIIKLAEENDLQLMYHLTPAEMADHFLAYTPLGRQFILDWYGGMRKIKTGMNWINKEGFEHKYFYIGGTDAVIAMMLLGFKVDSHRYANVSASDMKIINNTGCSYQDNKDNFFKRYGLKSKDINQSWNEWY